MKNDSSLLTFTDLNQAAYTIGGWMIMAGFVPSIVAFNAAPLAISVPGATLLLTGLWIIGSCVSSDQVSSTEGSLRKRLLTTLNVAAIANGIASIFCAVSSIKLLNLFPWKSPLIWSLAYVFFMVVLATFTIPSLGRTTSRLMPAR